MTPKSVLTVMALVSLAMIGPRMASAGSLATAADSSGTQPDSTIARADTTAARPDTTAATPVTPAPAAVAPAAVAPAAAATAPPATTTPAPAAAAKPQSAPNDRIYYGGTVALSFGSTSRIGIYPMIGYKLTPKISAGVEVGYEHLSYDNGQSTDNYGGSVFGRYRVGRNLYALAEYQSFNYEIFTGVNSSEREWVPALLLGGGYCRGLGGRMSAYAEVLFDVLQDPNSPYGDWEPVVTVGVAAGF